MEELGVDDYVPAATTAGGENETEPLAEQTIGPLLVWAMRMVDDLSEDILTAWAERRRLIQSARTTAATPTGQAALDAYLRPLIASQAPLPATVFHGMTTLARSYIGGITDASGSQIDQVATRESLGAAAARWPGPCPMGIPVAGRIAALVAAQNGPYIKQACALGARFATATPADLAALRRSLSVVYPSLDGAPQTHAFIGQIQQLKKSTPPGPAPAIPAGCAARH